MLKNYFKIAIRNLYRNKGFSFINILGLAIGMASAILILLWIYHEVSYDQFHEKKDRIYEAWNRDIMNDKINCWNTTPKILASALQKDNPEIERVVRVNWNSRYLFAAGEKKIPASGNFVDSGFLQMFSFQLLKGNPSTALNDPHSVVLTERLAKKLFGNDDPMGKTIKVENRDNFIVTGIVKDQPNNTRFDFESLMPFSYLRSIGEDDTFWGNNSTETYVLVKPNISQAGLTERVKETRRKYDKDSPKGEFFLYPISRWRLYSRFENGVETGGLIDFVKLMSIIAGFILLIACINFMNLSTARSEKRAREVGIRKVVGARKNALIGQFLGESILIALLSGILAILIVQFSLPAFNTLTGKILSIEYTSIKFWFILIGFIIFTGLLAGSYPAFFLSSFKPVKVLKGNLQKVNSLVTPRKVLVVLQFTFAIILIISTIIVHKQIGYARERAAGYDKQHLVYHFLSDDLVKNYTPLKNELISAGIASSVTKTSAPMTEGWSNSWGFEWTGKDPNDRTVYDRYCADDKIVQTAGLQLVSGRDIDLSKYPNDSNSIILNESAVKGMGFKEPLGQIIKDNGNDWTVVGVVKDFILTSPFHPTNPMVIEGAKGWFNVLHIKMNNQLSTSDNLAKMEALFKKYNPDFPFEVKFVDESYAKKFDSEKRTGTLAALFAGLTIFISCLGLFGLATYMAENRIKEIGIRKVLGASMSDITALLSKDFLVLVLIALAIAVPTAWWAMHTWLQSYPYRTPISVWVFVTAGALSLLITLFTVSSQAIKAAIRNPVKSLRSE
jgi:putative ABC transport system permease protein